MMIGARPKSVALIAAVCLLVAACGELTPPEAFAPTTSTSIVDGSEPETASEVQERPGLPQSAELFVPTPEPGYVPPLLVSGDQFLFSVDQTSSTPLTEFQTTHAVDDLFGGLVVQELDGPILYLQEQAEAQLLAQDGTLLGVGYWGGSPQAFVEAEPGRVDRIQLVAERPGAERERQLHFQLAEGEEIVAFSASGDLQAVIVQDNNCGDLRFFGSGGQLVDLSGPEPPPCVFPTLSTFGAVGLSPDGTAVAYTIVGYRSDGTEAVTNLVARELILGSDHFFDRQVGVDRDTVTSLSYDGRRAAYLKKTTDETTNAEAESVTLLDLTVDGREEAVDLLRTEEVYSVSFARIPVARLG